MADFNVQVKVDPGNAVSNTRKVERGLKGVENQADKTRKAIRNAFQFIGAAVFIRELVRVADAYTNMQNRLRVVTKNTQELESATEELYRIAQRTRSSFEGSVELYARVALATKEMGIQQKQLTEFTESLNQAIILSGASATEASAGLIQLSQGIASNTLRGDELRSVLEQLPAVADVIARSMGITRGELRTVAAEGQITAQVILDAFKEAREELQERFLKTVPTIGQSFQVLRNSITKAIGGFDDGIGVSRLFSRAIIGLSGHTETLIRIIAALAITIGVTLAAKAIPAAIVAIKALTAAMAANPIGFLVVSLTTAISLLITFSDKIKVGGDSLANLQDIGVATWESILAVTSKFIEYFKANFGGIFNIVAKTFNKMEFSIEGFLKFAAKGIDLYIGAWKVAYKSIIVLWKAFPAALKNIFVSALNGVINLVEKRVNFLIGVFNYLSKAVGSGVQLIEVEFGRIAKVSEGPGQDLGKALGDAVKEGFAFSGVTDFTENILKRAEEVAKERERNAAARKTKDVGGVVSPAVTGLAQFKTILDNLKREGELLKLNNEEREIQEQLLKIEKKLKRELTDTENGLVEAQLRENQALRVQAELFEQINGPVNEYKTTLEGLNALLEQGRINQEEFDRALSETQLATELTGLRSELGSPEEQITMELEAQLLARQDLIKQAQDARLVSEQEALTLLLEANQAYNDAVLQNELNRNKMQLGAASNAFGALANLSAEFGGKQSKTYQRLFAISKGFAIAQSTIAIVQGIAKSASLGFPANIGAIAATIAQTAGLVSQIKSVQYAGGFQTGGKFKVGGSGGADSQLVAFRASPNEEVSVKTPSQRDASNKEASSTEARGINIVNVVDKSLLEDYLNSPEGEDTLVNAIGNNRETISGTLQQQ